MLRRFIENLALQFIIRDLDIRGTATSKKMSRVQRDEAMAKVWMNKDFLAVMKDWIVMDIERGFYETEERKMHFRRGSALRTYKIMQVLQAAYRRHKKREDQQSRNNG